MAKPKTMREDEWEDLSAFLDGEVDKKTARALETKLNTDPTVRAEVQSLRRTWDLLDFLPKPEPSPAFASQTLSKISVIHPALSHGTSEDRWHPWILGVCWTAALFLSGMIGYTAVTLARPHPVLPGPVENSAMLDDRIVSDLRVIENKRLYELAGDMQYLRALDDPDLFGDEK
jgi:anti-sigma factor RsiW